jgi:FAD:protein FMN transferase
LKKFNILPIILCCCTIALQAQQRYAFSHPQMGTVFRLVFYTQKDSLEAAKIATSVFDHVDYLNQLYSDYIPESALNQLSDLAGTGQKMKVAPELYDILKMSKQFSKASNGAFDITVGALTRLWRKARHLKEVPDSTKIQMAVQTVNYRSIQFHKHHKVSLKTKGTRLDLGGIAQGYAADKCLEILRKNGITAALADAGGDIALGDAPPDTKGWAIDRPIRNANGVIEYEKLFLSNCGITTSGATYRFLEANGVKYSHIVDPRTGWGLTHGNLVTVQAKNAVTADAWATALSVAGQQDVSKMALKVWVLRYEL